MAPSLPRSNSPIRKEERLTIDANTGRSSLGRKASHLARWLRNRQPRGTEMGRQVAVVLYVVAMAAVIVGVDFVFFRNRFWERLIVNIGIVLVFAAFYLRFLRRP
jgi:ribosomal protein L13